jgi:hypothetical protein
VLFGIPCFTCFAALFELSLCLFCCFTCFAVLLVLLFYLFCCFTYFAVFYFVPSNRDGVGVAGLTCEYLYFIAYLALVRR